MRFWVKVRLFSKHFVSPRWFSPAHRSAFILVVCACLVLFVAGDATAARNGHSKRPVPANYAEYYRRHNGSITVFHDTVSPDGRLEGGKATMHLPTPKTVPTRPGTDKSVLQTDELPELAQSAAWNVATIVNHGPASNRLDWVIVGDGYTQSEMTAYAIDVNKIVNGWFAVDPFDIYANYFNVHRVDVISNQSGIDDLEVNPPVYVDTALDMYHEGRMVLIGDMEAVWNAIAAAPGFETGTALSNTTIYGGAGHPDIAAASGNNYYTVGLVLHEMGHSFGDLADEYSYEGETYTGGEPSLPNVSIYTDPEMASLQTKWHRWLDLPHISTFEGCYYNEFGIYRPTNQSTMNWLENPFYEVNAEQLIFKIYQAVSPIDDATPNDNMLPEGATFFVTPMQPIGHNLDIQWAIDGADVQGATDTEFTPDYETLAPGLHGVSVTVVDNTPKVRDEGVRAELMTDTRLWQVIVLSSEGSVYILEDDCLTTDTLHIALYDKDLIATGGHVVTLTTTGADTESLVLIETSADSGIFQATMNTTADSGTSGDGLLNVAVGQTITAAYADADDGSGQSATVEDSTYVSGATTILVQYDPGDLAAQGKRGSGPLPYSLAHADIAASNLNPTSQTHLGYPGGGNQRWSLGWRHDATSVVVDSDYLYFTVAPDPYHRMQFDTLSVRLASWSGNFNLSIRTSLDGYSGNNAGGWDKLGTTPYQKQTFDLSGLTADGPVEFRIYVWGDPDDQTGWHDVWADDGVRLNGAVARILQDDQSPVPDPPGWALAPHPAGPDAVSMIAQTALDQSGVQYYFTCIEGLGHDSTWQDSPQYTDTNLLTDTQYTYTVTARDKSPDENTTQPSLPRSALIDLYDGKMGMTDFAGFAAQWLTYDCGFCYGADLTGGGDVTLEDLFILVQGWPPL